jgi:hypothetical protein
MDTRVLKYVCEKVRSVKYEVENSEDTSLHFHCAYNVYMLYVLCTSLPSTVYFTHTYFSTLVPST